MAKAGAGLRRRLLMPGILAVLAIAGLVGLQRWIASMPIGTGETRASPDTRYSASVMDYHGEGFFSGRGERWFEFRVTGPGVDFAMRSSPLPGPYFGSRSSHSVIRWEEDSSAVTFVFTGSRLRVETRPPDGPQP